MSHGQMSRRLAAAALLLAFALPAPAEEAAAPAPAAPDPKWTPPSSEAEFQKAVEAAMKKRDEQKKADEEKKKKEEDEKKQAEGYTVGSSLAMTAVWKDGVYIQTANQDFVLHPGGSLQYDAAWYDAPADLSVLPPAGVGPFRDGTHLRRARIRLEGTFWETFEFITEYEFANGITAAGARGNNPNPASIADTVFNAPGPLDFYLGFKDLPYIGTVKVGLQKEPFSLEHLNSQRWLEFMERSFLFDAAQVTAFNTARSPGISVTRTFLNERLWASGGVFKNIVVPFGYGIGDGDYAVTGRLAGLPLDAEDGVRLIHLGVAGSHRDPTDGVVNARAREAIRNGPAPLLNSLANTGIIRADTEDLVQAEFAMVSGPLTVQAEALGNWIGGASTTATGPVGTVFLPGYYVHAMYFLTGEVRPYDKKLFRFGRVRPRENFFWTPGRSCWCCGKGAWEVGARYEQIDLTDRGINGGVLRGVTLGVNWYLNPNAKVQWNYDVTRRSAAGASADGTVQAFGMRVAYDF